MEEDYVWVADVGTGVVTTKRPSELDQHVQRYNTRQEALEGLREILLKEIGYNGRDITNAQKRVDELKMKQADDAVKIYRVMVQLGEIRAHQ